MAIKVVDRSGGRHFFLTWGRVFDTVKSEPLLAAIRPHLKTFGLPAIRRIEVCRSLRDAAGAAYFHEAFFALTQKRIPFGVRYKNGA